MKLILGKAGSGKSGKAIEIAKEHASKGELVLIVTSLAKELEDRFIQARADLEDMKDNFAVTPVRPETSDNPELTVIRGMMPVFGATPDVYIIHAEMFSRELMLAIMHLEPILKSQIYMVLQANNDFVQGVQVVDVEEVLN